MMNTISARIKVALDARNMKPADLTKMTGILKSSLSNYLSGTYEPKQKNISKIARALNINEDWLRGLDVPMEKNESVDPGVDLYNKLDTEDKAEIRGTMKQMLKAEKYSTASNENIKLVADSTESTHINARKKKPRMTE